MEDSKEVIISCIKDRGLHCIHPNIELIHSAPIKDFHVPDLHWVLAICDPWYPRKAFNLISEVPKDVFKLQRLESVVSIGLYVREVTSLL